MAITKLIEGIQRVISEGAQIVNLSLGGCLPHEYSQTYSDLIINNSEVLFIAAAGNMGLDPDKDACETPSFGTLEA